MLENKKILVVVESIDINATSGAKANVALINTLLLCKEQVTVLHYTRKTINMPLANCVAIKERKLSLNYLLSRSQRIFQRKTKINISKFLENIFGHSFTFFNDSKSIQKAIKKYYTNHDLIITLSQGASFRPHNAMLKLPELHSKWLAYVHDPYPFHLYPEPYNWTEAGYKQKEYFFRKVSERAKYSAFPSQLLKEWMGQFFPNFIETGLVIPHQQLKVDVLEELGVYNAFVDDDKFTLLHAGNLMKQRSPFFLIKAYRTFLELNPKAKDNSVLLLIGPASYHQKEIEIEQQTLSQLQLHLKNVPFNVVNTLQHRATVNIILESKSKISPFLPGKFPHCVFANKPILALSPKRSETRHLLGDAYPFVSEVDDVALIASKIETLYLNWVQKKEGSLNRPDLEHYLSTDYVKTVLNKIDHNN
ncbi:hypothetical protein [Lacinutrix algicola]|uniref:hypothetical protein n=1 Tax=Lacinutrix algicola TaxID=342954 RepID=UPI0006E129B6|nr:hypothetical protein [Lacinutrix algicola]